MDFSDVDDLAKKISQGDMASLARAITLVESRKEEHWRVSKKLVEALVKKAKPGFRLGLSGPPGVGKSSLIEKIGLHLVARGQKVAVLAIDPSSQISGGSILGDKTRMEELSKSPLAFVRPSPSRGHLGGVTSSMPAVLILCEAAGFDWLLIESVGVGQSEVELKHMVDYFVLLAQPGAGDELQGIKKGILEYVDHILVNKADLDKALVMAAKQQFLAALKIMRGKHIPVDSCSALTGVGVESFCENLQTLKKSWDFSKRNQQWLYWFQSLLFNQFQRRVEEDPQWQKFLLPLESEVKNGKLLPYEAVDQFFKSLTSKGSSS
ncbi:MAG: methylmalonyl Co-A mutase-associated GTPase MeaB [Bdellovibrionales bacterium]|nr:methylmalonyl Co-A mutase-associated GTPase MeaB [Bdellovibrionales bacterium]